MQLVVVWASRHPSPAKGIKRAVIPSAALVVSRIPCFSIVFIVFSFNLVGDGIGDMFVEEGE